MFISKHFYNQFKLGISLVIRSLFFFLGLWDFFPLNDCSIVTTNWNDHVFSVIIIESSFWDVLRVTCKSSARLRILQHWEVIDAYSGEIITGNNISSIRWSIDTIDIRTISSLWENSHNLPTKFASRSVPHWSLEKSRSTICYLNWVLNIIENFSVSLISSSDISWISGPIHSNNCWRMDMLNGPVHSIVTLLINLVDINSIVMRSNC